MKYQKEDLAYFPYQIEFAVNNFHKTQFEIPDFKDILICGLGGSGIAGRIIQRLFRDIASVPIDVISDYTLPAYISSSSLVILSSYSGNTEETLSMMNEAEKRNASIIAISSGGKIIERSKEKNYPYFLSEPGFQPRMALGYSLTYLIMIMGQLFDHPLEAELRNVSLYLRDSEDFIDKAESYFEKMKEKTNKKIILITDAYTYPIGVRFSQQLQENAKSEAFVHELPESNHNVIESYYGNLESVFFLINSHHNERMDLRFEFLEKMLKEEKNTVITIPFYDHTLKSYLECIFVLDWLSLIIADFKNINSSQIKNINSLKKVLGESKTKSGSQLKSD